MNGFEFMLNGRRTGAHGAASSITLLDYLRGQGLTGSKEGCAEGECGACTVVVVKQNGSGSEYRPVNSCLLLLPMLAGQEIYTVEALAANGRLADSQRAIAEHGGSQCGYCTPGFVMSLFAEQYRPGREGKCDPHAMAGNLCRCTGYRPLRDAALSLGPPPDDDFRARLSRPAPAMTAFECAGFSRPGNLADCLSKMEAYPNAKIIAGATDLAVEANLRGQRWPMLISTEALVDLKRFEESERYVELGAGLTLSEIERYWPLAPAVIREWFPLFASPLIRNRATLGGNLATASPIGDAAPLLLALDAELRIAGPHGERVLPLASFFKRYRVTALEAEELIVSILLPKPFPLAAKFYKVAKRRMDDISTVAACFSVRHDGGARVALGGVAATPVRIPAAEEALTAWNEAAIHHAQSILADTLRPLTDHRGSADYRLAMAQTLLQKFFAEHVEQVAA